jgi:hypothetical protein
MYGVPEENPAYNLALPILTAKLQSVVPKHSACIRNVPTVLRAGNPQYRSGCIQARRQGVSVVKTANITIQWDSSENLRGRDHLLDLDWDGRIVLTWILKK